MQIYILILQTTLEIACRTIFSHHGLLKYTLMCAAQSVDAHINGYFNMKQPNIVKSVHHLYGEFYQKVGLVLKEVRNTRLGWLMLQSDLYIIKMISCAWYVTQRINDRRAQSVRSDLMGKPDIYGWASTENRNSQCAQK